MQTIKAVNVKPLENYCLLVLFSNGETKVFDVNPYLEYKMFSPLKDKSLFFEAKTEGHTVVWNDAIDIDPRTLYWQGVSVKKISSYD
jgi:hypothetical protein